MKAYQKKETTFQYPDEMKIILEYLNSHGKLNISEKVVEELYRDFSDELYCASWMGIDSEEKDSWLLEQFADYLEGIDI